MSVKWVFKLEIGHGLVAGRKSRVREEVADEGVGRLNQNK